jgi:hypothetical protein
VPEKNPTEKPEQAESAEAVAAEAQPGDDAEAEAEVPLNRAARRGRASERQKLPPGNVGPQFGRTQSGRAQRSHTKRRSG